LKIQLPPGSTLALYDVVNTPGVGADLSHINTQVKVESHLGDLKNPSNVEARDKAFQGADVVFIPAGVPRKPGMTRDDLFKINAGIVRGLIEGIAQHCPKAWIALITNPVNSTVPVAAEILKKHNVYNPKRLFGVSTLDIVRAQTFIAELKSVDAAKVNVDVIGGHSPETMIPVLSKVEGMNFSEEEAKSITLKVKEAGTVIVNAKDGAGSATLSMAFAAARFANSIIRAINGDHVKEVAFVDAHALQVQTPTEYFGLSLELGKEGISKLHPIPKLNDYEEAQMKEAIPALEQNIQTGLNFAKASNENRSNL